MNYPKFNKIIAMKKLMFFIFALITIGQLNNQINAQQDAMYTQYMFNQMLLNPAYAGTSETISATTFYRNQWTGFDGAPTTFSLGLHAPFFRRVGLGINFESDAIGPISTFKISGNYAYKIPLKSGTISAGIKASMISYNADFSDVETIEADDIAYQENVNKLLPNFGLGLYYYNENFMVGFGMPRLLENNLSDSEDVGIQRMSALERHYYGIAGFVAPIGQQFKIKPTLLAKYQANSPMEVDISTHLIYNDLIWFGVSYRTNASVNFNLVYQVNNQIKIGYAYDYATTRIGQYSSGSHEITMSYDILQNKGNRIITPRYF